MHIAGSDKSVAFYSLDVILAVGYRTNSTRAIHFRIWATKILKNYLISGYAINERQFLETKEKFKNLQETIALLQEKAKHELLVGQEQKILNLLASYSKTLTLLEYYDKDKVRLIKKGDAEFILNYDKTKQIIDQIKKDLIVKKEAGSLFGQEANNRLKAILGSIYQTFDGNKVLLSAIPMKKIN